MNTEIVSLYCTSEREEADCPSIASVGELELHCTHIQNSKEVVITVNPNVTYYSTDTVEITWSHDTTFRIFDIHQRQTHSFSADGKKYEIEFLTWSRPKGFTLRFDFEVRYE
jgi:hypothetical protein